MPKTAILPKAEPVEEADATEEEEISPAKSIIVSKPSIASVTSTKFGGERMIQARKGLLERQSLEENCLIADGEELASFGMFLLQVEVPSPDYCIVQETSFSRPRPGHTGRSRSSTCTTSSSSGSETPPLSTDASSGESQSSIDVGQLNSMLSNATHPVTRPTHGRTRVRGQGHGHRRRPSEARHSMGSVYETIQEEGLGSPDPGEAPETEIPVAVYNSIHIVGDSDSADTEWDDERGILAMRKCGALKDEADDTVMESQRVWLDTPFSVFAVQSFQPPHHPSGMKVMLEHSQQHYVPLPAELRCHRVRSRTYSRPSPYPQRTIKPASPEMVSPQPSPRKQGKAVATIAQPLQPKSINVNSKTPAPALKNVNPISPFVVEFEKCKGDKSINERTIRPRVASSTRRAALGWSKRIPGKSSELKENTSTGTLNT
jgi:serine/arginine repetitive matrix protein 2